MAECIAKGIYRLDIPLPGSPLKNLNSYLIYGQDRHLLIDTGFDTPACLEAMKAELAALSVDMAQTDIFLTHMHADHTGLAAKLASDTSKIYISAVDAAMLDPSWLPQARVRLSAMQMSEGYPEAELQKSLDSHTEKSMSTVKAMHLTGLEDGAVLTYGGYHFTCILTPGHTPGHMCLYCQELKLMVLGDHVLFDITPNIVRWFDFDNALKAYLNHLEKIAQYDIEIALPGHRGVSSSVQDRCAAITAHHKERLEEVYKIVADTPGLSGYEIAGRMHWDIRCSSWADFPPSQKWFAVGEGLSHIDYLVAEGTIIRQEIKGFHYYYPYK